MMLDKTLILAVALVLGSSAQATEPLSDSYEVDAETGLRMERYRAPVPADVPGGTTLDSEQAVALKEQGEALFIDVYPPKGLGPDPLDGHWVTNEVRKSIPDAIWLPEVGFGTLTGEAEDYFKRNLVRLTENNLEAPVVFFCTSDCWQSWNASRRAIIWGYTNVQWYPLGSDGWLEADGQLAIVQPVNFFDDTTPSTPDETSTTVSAGNQIFPESAGIFLVDQQGKELNIGHVTFSATETDASGFSVEINSQRFDDHFLSMRPFRCITDPAEWFCYLPYPYELKQSVTPTDLTELEYQFLFIWKSPKDFGIDPWNGVYYQLEKQEDGSLKGTLLQGDLNILASPPEEPFSHPIDLGEFIDDDAQSRLFPSLIIRP